MNGVCVVAMVRMWMLVVEKGKKAALRSLTATALTTAVRTATQKLQVNRFLIW
jgi:hypothetical protein